MTTEKVLLKDQLFNASSVAQLGREYSDALPFFDADLFLSQTLSGFEERELLARLDWIADCIEAQLPRDFNRMADDLEAAMPPRLDPAKTDDDFGHFIHAVPGILAARHGLEDHRNRAMKLLHAATQRFSMEFYIRPFLLRWPEETLADLNLWVEDENYHVRRLVSEGTRPKLPWAKAINLSPRQTLPLLDKLHGDTTRYVTRSVSNHLNDIAKSDPEDVIGRLDLWRDNSLQTPRELGWMTRHALRTLVKTGHTGALELLGYRKDARVNVELDVSTPRVRIGDTLEFSCDIVAEKSENLLVDYRIEFARPGGRSGRKVFKLKSGKVTPDKPFRAEKAHRLKPDATTFSWYQGAHELTLQVNGVDRASSVFEVV